MVASIIFMNGPSSAGKSSLGRHLQSILDTPFLYFSSDQLVQSGVLPQLDRNDSDEAWRWSVVRPRFFDGFHRCIAALASAGNSLIVEHVLEFEDWFATCRRLLAPFDVFYVGVHCPLEELERRERERGDRYIGEARSHLQDGVHTWGPYDFEIDTSQFTPAEAAERVKASFVARSGPGVFRLDP